MERGRNVPILHKDRQTQANKQIARERKAGREVEGREREREVGGGERGRAGGTFFFGRSRPSNSVGEGRVALCYLLIVTPQPTMAVTKIVWTDGHSHTPGKCRVVIFNLF